MKIPFLNRLLNPAPHVAVIRLQGVIGMASGREANAEAQQMWMRKRVLYQAIAVGLAVLIMIVAGARGG